MKLINNFLLNSLSYNVFSIILADYELFHGMQNHRIVGTYVKRS